MRRMFIFMMVCILFVLSSCSSQEGLFQMEGFFQMEDGSYYLGDLEGYGITYPEDKSYYFMGSRNAEGTLDGSFMFIASDGSVIVVRSWGDTTSDAMQFINNGSMLIGTYSFEKKGLVGNAVLATDDNNLLFGSVDGEIISNYTNIISANESSHILEDGTKEIGTFVDGKLDGYGLRVLPNGTKVFSYFTAGQSGYPLIVVNTEGMNTTVMMLYQSNDKDILEGGELVHQINGSSFYIGTFNTDFTFLTGAFYTTDHGILSSGTFGQTGKFYFENGTVKKGIIGGD